MSKESIINLDGKIVEILPGGMFRVQVENIAKPVLGVISGKIRKHNIKIILGDLVEVEFSPYDLTRGRITRRK